MRLLNVGGGSKKIPIPEKYDGWDHDLLDITSGPDVDIVCDARKMIFEVSPAIYDAVYCSHNLEHYYDHEVPVVLDGIRYALKPDGVVHIAVPNIGQLICDMIDFQMDLETVMYKCEGGPVTPLDVFYGFRPEVETGNHWYAHKTGFSARRLHRVLEAAGFSDVSVVADLNRLELVGTGRNGRMDHTDPPVENALKGPVAVHSPQDDTT